MSTITNAVPGHSAARTAVVTLGLALLLDAGLLTAGLLTAGAASAVAFPTAERPSIAVGASSEPGDDPMPGMDMPAKDMPAQETPAQDEPAHDMPGMDMPAEDMPVEVDEHATEASRPRGLVLGTFAGVNAAVLLAALVLRHRTKNGHDRKRALRAAAPTTA